MNNIGNIPIYWINLNRSIDRKDFMESQFEKYKIPYTCRIEAVDGNNLNSTNYDLFHSTKIKKLNIYEIACTLSHIKALTKCYKDGHEYCIIMEDDCDFRYLEFHEKTIIELFNLNNDDIDVIQLITTMNACDLINIKKQLNNQSIIKGYKWNTGAYFIKRNAIKKILDLNCELTEADHYVYNYVNTFYTTIPYFRIGLLYDTLVHETESKHDKLIKWNTKFWDNYFYNDKK
ncbi:glycosyltransferase [Bodo saltans virus]|uniref:Glycosyltransferase n=1 Tax=Bodo saltans virus TaxID=2024608 RepID=A0A2H4UUS4_9VIRU|nr:glycosyltransferase [Bodo saltans virus]ATZ80599.1 glycosyltransferase [Bodo saltans virus]